MDYSGLQIGDVVEVGGKKIKLTGRPYFREARKAWYFPGYRWIKTRGRFSSSGLVHCVTAQA